MNMTVRMRIALCTIGILAAALVAPTPVSAQPGTEVFTLDDSSHGNPEGVASDGRFFYVGATGDGTIYRGSLGDPTVHTLIPGVAGRAAVGMKVSAGRLFVAGGPTGKIFVYDLSDPSAAPLTFDTGTGGFLNDLVVTAQGVFVTDSFRPTLWHIASDQIKSGGIVEGIPVGPEIAYTAGEFNLNGIVAYRGGRELVVVKSDTGVLYRIRFDKQGGRVITAIHGPALVGGDGMLKDRGRLIVVRGEPASLSFVVLQNQRSREKIREVRTDPTLRGPSTVARLGNRYIAVNADFATSTQPFTLSALER
jgi:hypothetical protein